MKTVEETPVNRRDMLRTVTGAVATLGLAAAAWPLINHLNPTASVGDFVDIDLLSIPEGTQQVLKWWGQPWFVWHRTAQDVELARAALRNGLRDSRARNANLWETAAVTFENRAVPDHQKFVILSGVCTMSLECVLMVDDRDQGHAGHRWSCPCCGSRFDSNGCVWWGPAPINLGIPRYAMLERSRIRVLPLVRKWQ